MKALETTLDLSQIIYESLNNKGADLGNLSVRIIKQTLEKNNITVEKFLEMKKALLVCEEILIKGDYPNSSNDERFILIQKAIK